MTGEIVDGRLGAYLRERRAKLDPAAFGVPVGRRRTPGLRREEVAQRANISPAWYTWLEQGRGGAPSADVLDRIARALMLTDAEREHVFLIALGRQPAVHYRRPDDISPRLQRVLDRLDPSPALIRTATWDVVAFNAAANGLLICADDRSTQRNILREMFLDPRYRDLQPDWDLVARFVVSAFRLDAARAGAEAEAQPLVDELSRLSPEFARLWQENDLPAASGNSKHFNHPTLGDIELEYSAFAVDGRADLTMIVYNGATAESQRRLAAARQS